MGLVPPLHSKAFFQYFSKNVQSRFRVYFWGFVLCQFLNLVVVLAVIGITNVFLHKRFLGYGFNVWYYYNLPPGEPDTYELNLEVQWYMDLRVLVMA